MKSEQEVRGQLARYETLLVNAYDLRTDKEERDVSEKLLIRVRARIKQLRWVLDEEIPSFADLLEQAKEQGYTIADSATDGSGDGGQVEQPERTDGQGASTSTGSAGGSGGSEGGDEGAEHRPDGTSPSSD